MFADSCPVYDLCMGLFWLTFMARCLLQVQNLSILFNEWAHIQRTHLKYFIVTLELHFPTLQRTIAGVRAETTQRVYSKGRAFQRHLALTEQNAHAHVYCVCMHIHRRTHAHRHTHMYTLLREWRKSSRQGHTTQGRDGRLFVLLEPPRWWINTDSNTGKCDSGVWEVKVYKA